MEAKKQNKRQKRQNKKKPAQKAQNTSVNRTQPPPKKYPVRKAVEIKEAANGFDIRKHTLVHFTDATLPAGLSAVLDVSIGVELDALQNVAIGFVGQLRQYGYASTYIQSSYPYWLANFIYQMFVTAATGGILPVETVPLGLLHFLQAIMPTNAKYKTGKIKYAFDLATTQSDMSGIMNYAGVNYNLGVPGPKTTMTLGYGGIIPPAAYSGSVDGLAAWNAMIAFIQDTARQTPMTRLVPKSYDTFSKGDTSAFALVYPDFGGSLSVGGPNTEVVSGLKVKIPLYSVLAQYGTLDMVPAEARVSAGSPRFCGARLITMAKEGRLHNKFKPIFKPVDFNDLWASLNYIIGTGLERLSQTNLTNQSTITYECPLTAKQAALLLRSALASLNNVASSSDITFSSVSNFIPLQFHFALANVSSIIKSWNVPFLFSENIRSLAAIASGIPNPESNHLYYYLPVFGVYESLESYDYTWGEGLNIYKQVAEEPYFDMPTLLVNNAEYTCPVGAELSSAIDSWNVWFQQLATVIPATTFCSGTNNPALFLINSTRYTVLDRTPDGQVIPSNRTSTPVPAKGSKSNSMKIIPTISRMVRTVKSVKPASSPIEQEIAISSNLPIENEVFQVTNYWVLPKMRLFTSSRPSYQASVEGIFYEPYHINCACSVDEYGAPAYPLLSSKWQTFGTVGVVSPSSQPNQHLSILQKMDANGQGGFLSQIIADFAADKLNMPFLSSFGSLLPF